MKSVPYKCIGAPLPPFCRKCGLVESHPVHRGHYATFNSDGINPHKFKEERHDANSTAR